LCMRIEGIDKLEELWRFDDSVEKLGLHVTYPV
jgi:hypothetical protein